MSYCVQNFYCFKALDEKSLGALKSRLLFLAQQNQVRGLVILAPEGVNTTLSCDGQKSLQSFVDQLLQLLNINREELFLGENWSSKNPFRRFSVKIRPEIVTLNKTSNGSEGSLSSHHNHLSPKEWHDMISQEEVVILDTRNDYEFKMGTFKKAVHLHIKTFSELPEKMAQMKTDLEKPHLIFCTGGIRCEKAIYEMEDQGFKKVYQLKGGILNYLKEFPQGHFEGECFVFDSRVSLNPQLQNSQKYSLCPHCGDMASIPIICKRCDSLSQICPVCHGESEKTPHLITCSKNCRHHYKLRPGQKGPQQKQFYHEKTN